MTSSDVVTGGQEPTRHHNLVRLLIGAVCSCLALALVFTSGFLLGSSKSSQQTPTAVKLHPNKVQPRVVEGLPAPAKHAQQVHGPQKKSKKKAKPEPRFVTVGEGDSLWGIATSIAPHKDAQVVVARILELNSLEESSGLEIGQQLRVPGTTPSPRHERPRHDRPRHDRSHHERPRHDRSHHGPKSAATSDVALPVFVSIPRMDLRQDIVELNVIGGTLQVPTDYGDVGWWRDGPRPGASGSAVIVGHVDSPTGPAVFYGLSATRVGDVVTIGRADGTKARFRVSDATLYPRESFPSASVYKTHGRPTLTLITCGGSYDATAGHYTGNLVVTAHLVKPKHR